jgi:hypothetical protein
MWKTWVSLVLALAVLGGAVTLTGCERGEKKEIRLTETEG